MKTLTPEALSAAERYVLLNARLLDRLRFAHQFQGGSAQAVRAAVVSYANADGGFGNAIEPDLRGPGSQPEPVEVALRIWDETTTAATPFDGPVVRAAADYLASVTTTDGGVPFVLPSVRETLAAPWWDTPDDPPGHLIPTGSIAGLLFKHGVDHPWLEPATEFCWRQIDSATELSAYQTYPVLTFLDHVPDRPRAAAAFERLRPLIRQQVSFDPQATGDVHLPLDLAETPDGFARRLFDDAEIETHLDALIESQHDDGGWGFNWPAWTPIVTPEWGGYLTVGRLITLRAYGRWDSSIR